MQCHFGGRICLQGLGTPEMPEHLVDANVRRPHRRCGVLAEIAPGANYNLPIVIGPRSVPIGLARATASTSADAAAFASIAATVTSSVALAAAVAVSSTIFGMPFNDQVLLARRCAVPRPQDHECRSRIQTSAQSTS